MLKEFTDGRCIVDLTDFIAVANILQCVTIASIQEMASIHILFQAKTETDIKDNYFCLCERGCNYLNPNQSYSLCTCVNTHIHTKLLYT